MPEPCEQSKCDHGCEACPVYMAVCLQRAYRLHVETAVVQWLQTMTHTPSCGYEVKGDLIRWQIIQGHRLPTVRDDLIEKATTRCIESKDGRELIAILADMLEPKAREMLAVSLAVQQ